MRKLLFMAYLLSIVLIQNSLGFDDSRKGFIVGLGMGVQSSKNEVVLSGRSSNRDYDGIMATSFKIGYGFNDNFLLHYTNDVSWVKFPNRNDTWAVGVTAIAGTYYFNTQAPSMFITAGYGLGAFRNISEPSSKDSLKGSGWILGGGYEFDKHINIEISMFSADFNGDSKLSSNYTKFDVPSTRFTINYLWY